MIRPLGLCHRSSANYYAYRRYQFAVLGQRVPLKHQQPSSAAGEAMAQTLAMRSFAQMGRSTVS